MRVVAACSLIVLLIGMALSVTSGERTNWPAGSPTRPSSIWGSSSLRVPTRSGRRWPVGLKRSSAVPPRSAPRSPCWPRTSSRLCRAAEGEASGTHPRPSARHARVEPLISVSPARFGAPSPAGSRDWKVGSSPEGVSARRFEVRADHPRRGLLVRRRRCGCCRRRGSAEGRPLGPRRDRWRWETRLEPRPPARPSVKCPDSIPVR